MRFLRSTLLLPLAVAACTPADTKFALCRENGVLDDRIVFLSDGTALFSDLAGDVVACTPPADACVAHPIALSAPPHGSRPESGLVRWRHGNVLFEASSDPKNEHMTIRAENDRDIFSYEYDLKSGVEEMVLTPKKSGFSSTWKTCSGKLVFDDLKYLVRQR